MIIKSLLRKISKGVFAYLLFCSCNSTNLSVDFALKASGKNREELEKVLTYFEAKGNEEQLEAAKFLIENMPGKKYKTFIAFDSLGKPTDPNVVKSSNSYVQFGEVEDIKVIKAHYLIENIEYAFKAWAMPWAKHLSFLEFCEYLLPYRYGEEPLSNWRKESFNQMQILLKNGVRDSSVINICKVINDNLKTNYAFRHYELASFPGLLSFHQIKIVKGGRCEDLNMLGAYYMRSIGIPVASEFTPVWSNSNFGGHAWLSVLNEDKKFVPFNVAYDNPSLTSDLPFKENKLCKAYRRTFANNSVDFRRRHLTEYCPNYLNNSNFYDITQTLITTKSFNLSLREKSNSTLGPAFVGVLSGYDWQPIDTVDLDMQNKVIHIKHVGLNSMYITFAKSRQKRTFLSYPIFVDSIGKCIVLNPNNKARDKFTINFSKDYWWLRKDRAYSLFYWKNNSWNKISSSLKWEGTKWKPVDQNETTYCGENGIVVFSNIPKRSLLRIQNLEDIDDIGSYGRPFLFYLGHIVTI